MALKAASIVTIAAAGSVSLNWDDCGDADTHTVITDISPVKLALPGQTTITGSGIVDKDVNAGQFKFDAKLAGVSVLKDGGSLCEDKEITMPLNAGTIKFHGVSCPVSAGEISVTLDINLLDSSAITNDLVTIDLSGLDDTGDKLLCAALSVETPNLESHAVTLPDCSTEKCPDNCQCAVDHCANELEACLADTQCTSGKSCLDACDCDDVACKLKCEAANPSLKAVSLANCAKKNCQPSLSTLPDCSTVKCPDNCQCAVEHCASELEACLADTQCTSGKSCLDACDCDDVACKLKCEAANPSLKAVSLANCGKKNCLSTGIAV